MNERLVEAALSARDLVLDGWTQETGWRNEAGVVLDGNLGLIGEVRQVCIAGALAYLVGQQRLTESEGYELEAAWEEANPGLRMGWFNDSPFCTQEKAAGTWDKTATWLKER